MFEPRRSPAGSRRGYSLLELQAAFIVLGFSVAALVPFAIAQLKLVAAMEKRLPPNATYVMMSRDHGMVSLLASGSGSPSVNLTPGSAAAPPTNSTSAPNEIAVQQVGPFEEGGIQGMDLTATVKVNKVASPGGI